MKIGQTFRTQHHNREQWEGDNVNGYKCGSDKSKYDFVKHIVKMGNLLLGDNQVKYCVWNEKMTNVLW